MATRLHRILKVRVSVSIMSLRQVGDDEMVAIKVVVTGSAGVGKTKTVGTLKGEAFQELYEETHGESVSLYNCTIESATFMTS